MIYKRFSFQLILRVILLLAVLFLISYLLHNKEYIKAGFTVLLLSFSIFELFRFVSKTNQDYINFLNALANKDYTANYSEKLQGGSFGDLYKNFDKISEQFRLLNYDRELQFQHLQHLIKNIDTGIVSFDEVFNIHLVNDAFKEIFNLPYLQKGQSFKQLHPDFLDAVKRMKSGENLVLKFRPNNQIQELLLNASHYKFEKNHYRLISVKNINSALDNKEQESYQKLISVLTHEIMNSVTPIVSLSSTLDERIKSSSTDQFISEGIAAIHDRSRNLLDFTHEYRKLTKLPPPRKERINIHKIVEQIKILLTEQLHINNIQFSSDIDAKLETVYADEKQLEQVLLNIYKNAIEALKACPKASILTHIYYSGDTSICIEIEDNGEGISKEKLNKIFIPFYTDKENGNGIGLSLCKQIINHHGGRIVVDSVEGAYTKVSIYLSQKPIT